MRQAFLDKVAQHIVENYADKTDELCIVLPNRRAGLFLRSLIGKKASKPLWSPAIFSIEDFIFKLSDCEPADTISLLFKLYSVYRKNEGSEAQSIDEFLKWGQSVLSDFNEVDMHLAPAEKLFSRLSELKEMDAWNPETGHAGSLKNKYLKFYFSLGRLHADFTKELLNEKQIYYGLACRIVSKSVSERCKKHNFNQLIFAGFNALSISENKIIETLVREGIAETLWDADSYYFDDDLQEAGAFIRKYFEKEKILRKESLRWKENLLSTDEKYITVIGVAKDVGQAKIAGDILRKEAESATDFSNTALVLADENLLFPVLHSLPENVKANVTMGYPLRNHPLTGFFQQIFSMQETAQKLGDKGFYYRDVFQLFNHPYFIALTSENRKWAREREEYIRVSNRVFVRFGDVAQGADGSMLLVETLFNSWLNSPPRAVDDLLRLCVLLNDNFMQNTMRNATDLEFLFELQKIFLQLQNFIIGEIEVKELKTLSLLFKRLTASASLPFYGEPLSGLQIMGMLETRTLDFENVILLSASEGFLPAASHTHSFIPYEIKKQYNLPVTADKDAVFAYHFYRLLQRAKNIYLLYNTEPGELGGGEKSRFLRQLQSELPRKNPNAVVRELLMTLAPATDIKQPELTVDKTDEILARLKEMAENGISPSALNTYKRCKLQFYFQYIERLTEREEVEETIEAATFGTVIHAALEELYLPLEGREITVEDIKAMQTLAADTVKNKFTEIYKSEEIGTGKNLISLRIAQRYVARFLENEIEFLKNGNIVALVKTELELKTELNVNGRKIFLSGKADRIDLLNNRIVRVIDYKTGKVRANEIKVSDFGELSFSPDLNKGFQLLFYAWLFRQIEKPNYAVQAGIYSFRELSAGLKTLKLDTPEMESDLLNDDAFTQFENALLVLLDDFFSTESSFTQTEDLKICETCSFSGICRR